MAEAIKMLILGVLLGVVFSHHGSVGLPAGNPVDHVSIQAEGHGHFSLGLSPGEAFAYESDGFWCQGPVFGCVRIEESERDRVGLLLLMGHEFEIFEPVVELATVGVVDSPPLGYWSDVHKPHSSMHEDSEATCGVAECDAVVGQSLSGPTDFFERAEPPHSFGVWAAAPDVAALGDIEAAFSDGLFYVRDFGGSHESNCTTMRGTKI